jgi:hypothetical protein
VFTGDASPVPKVFVADILTATRAPVARTKLPALSVRVVKGMLHVVPEMTPESAPSQYVVSWYQDPSDPCTSIRYEVIGDPFSAGADQVIEALVPDIAVMGVAGADGFSAAII